MTEADNGSLTSRRIQRYGWVPDLPDARDFMYAAPEAVLADLPKSVDLRPDCPPVYDQGQLGSCTANGIGAAFEFDAAQGAAGRTSCPPGCSSTTTSA